MSHMKLFCIGLGALAGMLLMLGSALAIDIRVEPDTTQVFPGQELAVNVVVDNVPAAGLSAVQFRLRVAAPGGTVAGVDNLNQADSAHTSVAAPLNSSAAGNGYSGLGGFVLGQVGPDGVLFLDNQAFDNEIKLVDGVPQTDVTAVSALFSYAQTSSAALSGGSGVVARFLIRVGTAMTAYELDFSLSDVVLLDGDMVTGPQEYPLDNNLGSTVALGCQTLVPDLTGLSFDDAQQTLLSADLVVEEVYELNNPAGSYVLGQVLEQSVPVGTSLSCGSEVGLAINSAPAEIIDLQGADLVADQSGSVVLSWTPSPSADASFYEIYQAETLLASGIAATVTDYQISGLQSNLNNLLKVVVVDSFGNRSSGTVVSATPRDDVAPTLAVDAVLLLTAQAELLLSGTVEEGAVVTVFHVTGEAWPIVSYPAAGQWQVSLTLAEEGNLLQIAAQDVAGNTTEAADLAVTLDTLPPALILEPVSTSTDVNTQTIGGTVEEGALVTVSVASTATVGPVNYAAGTWLCTVSGLVEGDNEISVSAVDEIGNKTLLSPVIIAYQSTSMLDLTLAQGQLSAGESLQIGMTLGLTNAGGSVTVEQIVDLNGNLLVDSGEPVIRRLVLSDDDADNSIVADLNMLNSLAIDHAPGSYLIRVSDGVNEVVTPFTVDPVSELQALSGRVTDGTTVIAGAQVQLLDKWQRPVAWAITDGTGDYLFQVPEAGDYYVIPQAEGFAFDRNGKTPVPVAAGAVTLAADLLLAPGMHTLSGQIYAGSTGHAGIRVAANGNNGNGYSARTLTTADGSYSILLPEGDYIIQVVADSYAGPSRFNVLANSATDLALTVDADLIGIDFTLPTAELTVSGIVTDEAAMPVAGLPVVAMVGNVVVATTVSAADGSYSLPLAASSSYTITVDAAAATTQGYVGQQLLLGTATADLTGQNLSIHSIDSWVAGLVTDDASAAVTDLPVQVRSADNLYNHRTQTAVDGSYRLGTFDGSWFVRAEMETQGFTPAAEVGVTAQSGQEVQVDFVASSSGFAASCLICHDRIDLNTDCLTCHEGQWPAGAPNLHHDAAVSSTWGYDCQDCHPSGVDPVTGAYGLLNPTVEQCESCHFTLIASTTNEQLHHNAPAGNLPNVEPVALDGTYTTLEDSVVSGTLSASDGNSDPLTYSLVSETTNGSVVIIDTSAGHFTYTPMANYNGSDSFIFRVNDGMADSATATISITVTSVNDAPESTSVTISTNKNTASSAFTPTVTDPDSGETFTFNIESQPVYGVAELAGQQFIYTPEADFHGSDSFTFRATDTAGLSVVGIASVTVNDAPITNTLGVTVNGQGTVYSEPGTDMQCTDNCAQDYIEGALVTLTANPATNYSFDGWTGDCTGTGDCTVTIDAAKSVTATFSVYIPYPVLLENTQGTYTTIQSAYDSIPSGQVETIKVKAGEQAPGDLMFDRNVTIRLEGGYDDIFENVVSDSSYYGTLKISGEPVIIMDLRIK